MIVDQHIIDILSLDMYDKEEAKGTLSATTLCKSPREIVLLERYGEVAPPPEPMDRVWSTLGSLVHLALEILAFPMDDPMRKTLKSISFMANSIKVHSAEERLKYNVQFAEEGLGDEMVSGKYDFIKEENNSLYMCDYKVTGGYSIKMNPYGKLDWLIQLSINRWLYWKVYGVELNIEGHIYVWVRDWNARAAKGQDYPKQQLGMIPIHLWDFDATEKYVMDKLMEVKRARKMPDDHLPLCADTWHGRKCESYCAVRAYCNKRGQELS